MSLSKTVLTPHRDVAQCFKMVGDVRFRAGVLVGPVFCSHRASARSWAKAVLEHQYGHRWSDNRVFEGGGASGGPLSKKQRQLSKVFYEGKRSFMHRARILATAQTGDCMFTLQKIITFFPVVAVFFSSPSCLAFFLWCLSFSLLYFFHGCPYDRSWSIRLRRLSDDRCTGRSFAAVAFALPCAPVSCPAETSNSNESSTTSSGNGMASLCHLYQLLHLVVALALFLFFPVFYSPFQAVPSLPVRDKNTKRLSEPFLSLASLTYSLCPFFCQPQASRPREKCMQGAVPSCTWLSFRPEERKIHPARRHLAVSQAAATDCHRFS